MSKAEDRALEKYPAHKSVFDKYEKQRYAFICGYRQAEKDLELSWEDVKKIEALCFKVDIECDLEEKEYYEEVLKRFKEKEGE